MTAKEIIFSFFLFLIFSWNTNAQEADPYIYKQIEKITLHNRAGEFNDAYRLTGSLVDHLTRTNAPDSSLAIAYFYKGNTEIYLGKYYESIRSTRKSLKLFSLERDSLRMATCLNQIGVNYYYLSDYDSTKIYYERSFLMKKKNNAQYNELAVSAYNLAMAYEDLLEIEKALELYKEAEKYLLLDKEGYSFLPDVYLGIANIYVDKKDVETAERYAEKAIDVGVKAYGEFNPNTSFIYALYGDILLSKKKYKEAIDVFQKALKIREDTYGHNHVWTCESNISLAKAYLKDEQYKRAEEHLKTAIAIGKRIKSYQYLASAQTELADLYIGQKIHTEKVEGLLTQALETRKRIFGKKNDLVAQTYHLLAKNDLDNNNQASFFRNIENTYNSVNYDKSNVYSVISPFEVIEAMDLEGEWYQREYDKDHKIDHLIRKFNLIDAQIEMIKFSQRNFSSDHSKISIANNYRSVFEEGLFTCWQLYKETREYKYLEKAFEVSEANRNTTLLSGLQDHKFKLYANIPPELLSHEKELKKELARVKMDIYYERKEDEPDKELLSDLIGERLKLHKDLDSLHTVFIRDYSRYKSLKFNNHILKIEDVQKELDDKSQLIIYFLEEKDLYTFSVTSNQARFTKNNKNDLITREIRNFKKDLLDRKDISAGSRKLYDILLRDQLDPNKEDIIIIPDNILSYIPFEVLKDEKNNYILEQHRVSYSGSTRLFLELKEDFFNYDLPHSWVGFSPLYKRKNRLNATGEEVDAIGRITEGVIFSGNEATKENFLTHNDQYNIIHLAMHARIDHDNPMFNKLEFSDGDLTSSEIYFSGSKTNLVVLSACNTGFGKIEKGEGVMSLARAFHFSGVPAVVMSLWKVPDKETEQIMVYFYEFLKKGFPKSEALQKAKIKYLKNTKDASLKHPYYWSGFVLNGNTVALYKNSELIYLLILIGIFILTLFFLIFRKYSK